MELYDPITQRVEDLYKRRQISINKLSIICGMTQSSLNNIINGDSLDPKISTIKKICDGLEMKLSNFFDCSLFDNLEQQIK